MRLANSRIVKSNDILKFECLSVWHSRKPGRKFLAKMAIYLCVAESIYKNQSVPMNMVQVAVELIADSIDFIATGFIGTFGKIMKNY